MSDFFSLRIRGRHGRYSVAPFEAHLPAFRWRQGDSDAQGPYVSGSRPDGVHIKFWWGEQPHDLTVSFRSSAADAAAMED